MEPLKAKILLVEDDSSFVAAFKLILRKTSLTVDWAASAQDALAYLKNNSDYAVVVIDKHLPNIQGDELALTIRKFYPDLQIIYTTGDLTHQTLTNLLKSGVAMDFIPKGQSQEEVLNPVLKAVDIYKNEKRILKDDDTSGIEAEQKLLAAGIVGRSDALLKILKQREAFKKLPLPTLILGESGTGKEVIAKAFAQGITEILPINCSTYLSREQMMDTELFGYVRGAFTDARKDTQGIFEVAKGRIVFLDEIHHLSISGQAKLLRVLQEKKVVRVGDHSGHAIPCDFKIIAAGKPDLLKMIKDGSFLPDLYFRLATYTITIPPLSERIEDIEPLVEYFAKTLRYKTKIQKNFRAATIRLMEQYSWPGEVRELRSFVERLFGETKSDIIEPADFLASLANKFQITPQPMSDNLDYGAYMKMIETDYLTKALKQSATQKDAAALVGLSTSTFNNRLKQLGIDPIAWLRPELKKLKSELELS